MLMRQCTLASSHKCVVCVCIPLSSCGKRFYHCSIWQKSFITISYLVNYEVLHSGRRPYACSSCQKTFTAREIWLLKKKGTLKRNHECLPGELFRKCEIGKYEKIPSDMKWYVCHTCKKRFADQ